MKFVMATAIAVLALLTVVGAATAHGRYLDTAYNTEKNIERKFPRVVQALCRPLPAWARGRYGAFSEVRGTVRKWNHFLCAVAIRDDSACLVVAHMTGPRWNQFVLTGWQGQGCTPRQLRG